MYKRNNHQNILLAMYTKRNLLFVYNVDNIIKKLIACYVSTIIVM